MDISNWKLPIAAALAAAMAGCGTTTPPLPLTTTVTTPAVTPVVIVSPTTPNVTVGSSVTFSATASGTPVPVTWSVAGNGCSGASCGTISSTGVYTAPATVPNPAQVTIVATPAAGSGVSASATITPAPVSLTVSPAMLQIGVGDTRQLSASVQPASSVQSVTWSISGQGCSGLACGSIDKGGAYTAPAQVPSPATVTVTATSAALPNSTVLGTTTITVTPPAAPTMVVIGSTHPSGIAVLAFSLRISSALLEPGDVPLISNSTVVELSRLLVEKTLVATNMDVVGGNYRSVTFTVADPVVTILNTSTAPVSGCSPGQVCKLKPALASTTVTVQAPVSITPHTNEIVELDFDLGSTLQSLDTITPAASVQATTDLKSSLRLKQVDGNVVNGFGDSIDGSVWDIETPVGTLENVSDYNAPSQSMGTVMIGGALYCGGLYFCQSNTPALTDVTLNSLSDLRFANLVYFPGADHELEGTVTNVGPTSADIVLLHQTPDTGTLEVGDTVRVNFLPNATFACWTDAQCVDTVSDPLAFKAATLQPGQVIAARVTDFSTANSISTDRVSLQDSAITGTVTSIPGQLELVLQWTGGGLPIGSIDVRNVPTGSISVGDSVSVSGAIMKSASGLVLYSNGYSKN